MTATASATATASTMPTAEDAQGASAIAMRLSGLRADSKPPLARRASTCQMARMLYGRCDPSAAMVVMGLYDFELNKLFVHEDWDRLNVYDRSVLVHEYVHWLQDMNMELPVEGLNPCAIEPLAYNVQMQYLSEQRANGVAGAKQAIDIHRAAIKVLSRDCARQSRDN